MRNAGIWLWGIGATVVAYCLFIFDTSVEIDGQRIINFDLQHQQMTSLIVGGLMVLIGAILHAMSHVRPGQPVAAVEPEPTAPKRDLAAEMSQERAALDASLARRSSGQ